MFKRIVVWDCLSLMLALVLTSAADASDFNLLAWWPLDGGSGNTVVDISGSGNNGTIHNVNSGGLGLGGSVWYNDPDRGMVLSFSGNDSTSAYVSFEQKIPKMTMENGFTWSFWAKQQGDGSGGNDIILGNRFGGTQDQQWIKFTPNRFEYVNLNHVGTIDYDDVPGDVWVHMAIVKNRRNLTHYRNGEVVATTTITDIIDEIPLYLAGGERGERWAGWLSDVYLYTRALTQEEILLLMKGLKRELATDPVPEDKKTDVLRDVTLVWEPGIFAAKHDLFFGTNFEDINVAGIDSPLLIGPSLDVNSIDLDRLEFGQTYFWRVDEINAPPDNTVFKGDLWSFTVEPLARPISTDSIIATASSQAEGQGPENTINESGLVDDLHSVEIENMWVTVGGESLPVWIQYEFDKTYILHEMLVWNYNGVSFLASLGLQDVTVEYSVDGVNWILNDSVSVFNKATGKDDYVANTTVPFGDVPVKCVKITVNSNWGGGDFFNQYGLSEVRFMYIPVNAREPDPKDEASGIDIDVILGWKTGRDAAEHNVYISDDEQAVVDGTVPVITVSQTSYGPLSLDLASTYYWRIDEVNNANIIPVWEGDTWSFTTSEYLVVDDFDSYYDIPEGEEGSNLVYLTWIDGYDNPAVNGSTIGYVTGSSLEAAIVRSGHSAPLMYNNTTAGISKVTANTNDLQSGSDWTIGSPEELVLWIYGSGLNQPTEQMYVEVDGVKKIFNGDITAEEWQDFPIDLASLGINLSNVGTVTIGLERIGSPGGSGMVFIDDILLHP